MRRLWWTALLLSPLASQVAFTIELDLSSEGLHLLLTTPPSTDSFNQVHDQTP